MAQQSNIAPGYCIVQQPGTLDFQARMLFTNTNSDAARYFMQLNRDTPWLKPGQILIVADYQTAKSQQLEQLISAKKKVNTALNELSSEDADFFNKHYATIAAVTNAMDKSLGVISDAGEKYFKAIDSRLRAIEVAYQNQFRTQGTLFSEQFVVERKMHFAELNKLLNKISRLTLKLKPYNEIKHALGLSSRSIVHDWSTAGVGAIKGYSTYVENATKAARFLKAGGWVAIGFSGINTTNDVYHACTTGRESECTKVAVKKYSKFGASVAGGIYGGQLGSGLGAGICIALGAVSGGAGYLVCSIVGAAVGGYIASEGAGSGTEYIMDKILHD
ncbi:hypothetical protein RJ492_004226 [Pluralibacter gergoviae]|uniref:SSU ribosomal protein S2p (SAe) n=1 Tax=Pluralibacter gergoviae TaxID=61647 RepID=A0AAI9DNR0_PLUGE|nr:hypothetical protein [Pluralibacter gergoviae]EKV0916995.1 hypothetical protein [Pluralibacter gergoviae]EKV9911191.1 hypothetical protein [Pluralibacter gergoviae]EKW7275350.1 hypothetical protein [Pluralibacter gergoviae]ELD4297512.1 hypothetical protein [Pluralibacter gergoviae]ELD4308259.1 hypothetical protein [Pluralibacter gergoviae]